MNSSEIGERIDFGSIPCFLKNWRKATIHHAASLLSVVPNGT